MVAGRIVAMTNCGYIGVGDVAVDRKEAYECLFTMLLRSVRVVLYLMSCRMLQISLQ
jgi:hypothetical protein